MTTMMSREQVECEVYHMAAERLAGDRIRLMRALEGVVPFAESRAEDLLDDVRHESRGSYGRSNAAKALRALRAAERTLRDLTLGAQS